jgi:2-C-methyl-D-erythritol 4-phosphate cytidylyltransferase
MPSFMHICTMSVQPEYALIVAGGKGTRMKASLPKQFLEIKGRPVLMHTIDAFYRYSGTMRVILVLPEEDRPTWEALCQQHAFTRPLQIVAGGASRFQSVQNGLRHIQGAGLVAIHDGVRPLISEDIIAASFRLAAVHGSAVAAVRLKDSIRVTDQHHTRAVDRALYRLIQTPQTFRIDLIQQAYALPEDATLTDDASVAERAGHTISLFEGSYDNLKITTPEDLIVAEALLNARQ